VAALDKDEHSSGEIFRSSFAAWNVFAGVMLITMWLDGDLKDGGKEKGVSLQFEPHHDGALLRATGTF
jgi:hypothetical protein